MGFRHLLLCTGGQKKEVYFQLYKTLKKSGVGAGKKTLVYPLWVREVVCERFQEPGGRYDGHYDQKLDVSSTDLCAIMSNMSMWYFKNIITRTLYGNY